MCRWSYGRGSFIFKELVNRSNLAKNIAILSGKVIKSYYNNFVFAYEDKLGSSPLVTVADKKTEEFLRSEIARIYPEDSIYGEEFPNFVGKNEYLWIIDPIDGTSAFARSLPTFSTLIACSFKNELRFGVLNQPILEHTFVGDGINKLSFNSNDLNLKDIGKIKISECILSSTTPYMFVSDYEKDVIQIIDKKFPKRAFSGDAYLYAIVAAQKTLLPTVIVEADLKYHDFAAVLPIFKSAKVSGSSAFISDWEGNFPTTDTTRLIAAPNEDMAQEVCKLIANL
jgi:inositol-phosphate phosphatase / L-galactose 1-phosphate phosphatase / histidinol-phosphatase